MKFLQIWSVVEVQIAAKDLVRPFSGQYNLDSLRFDVATKEVHRSRGANCGDVVTLQMVDQFVQEYDSFLKVSVGKCL
jgi:uncharacterized protein (DUF2252 family)